jgi:hypothetical protein
VLRKSNATLDVRTRAAWHEWLEKHHRSATVIWLVFHSIEGMSCFDWIDSLVGALDDDRSNAG